MAPVAIRLFLCLFLFILWPGVASAQEPVTITGQIVDGGVTRTVTLTVVLTPSLVSSIPAYTSTLTTGNEFELERSISYGQILAGAGGVMGVLLLLFLAVAGVFNGRHV